MQTGSEIEKQEKEQTMYTICERNVQQLVMWRCTECGKTGFVRIPSPLKLEDLRKAIWNEHWDESPECQAGPNALEVEL